MKGLAHAGHKVFFHFFHFLISLFGKNIIVKMINNSLFVSLIDRVGDANVNLFCAKEFPKKKS